MKKEVKQNEVEIAYHKGFYEGTKIVCPNKKTLKESYEKGYRDCLIDYHIEIV